MRLCLFPRVTDEPNTSKTTFPNQSRKQPSALCSTTRSRACAPRSARRCCT
jgi:hypothetical protein